MGNFYLCILARSLECASCPSTALVPGCLLFFWRHTLTFLVFVSSWHPTVVLCALHLLTLLFYRALLGTPSLFRLISSLHSAWHLRPLVSCTRFAARVFLVRLSWTWACSFSWCMILWPFFMAVLCPVQVVVLGEWVG